MNMKSNLKEMKEFIILLDTLDGMMRENVLNYKNENKEMLDVIDSIKQFMSKGILNNFEEIEEVLIIVDTVNGFMVGGLMANPKAMHIVPKQIKLIEKILERNGLLIFAKECHDDNSTEFNDFPSHCLAGSWESELIEELKPYEKYGITIEKNSTSFVFARGFLTLMKLLKNLKRVYGNGVCGDICVPNGFMPLKNYFDQNNRNVEIVIPLDSIDTFDSFNHDRFEYQHASNMLMEQTGIKLVKTINDIEWSVK